MPLPKKVRNYHKAKGKQDLVESGITCTSNTSLKLAMQVHLSARTVYHPKDQRAAKGLFMLSQPNEKLLCFALRESDYILLRVTKTSYSINV